MVAQEDTMGLARIYQGQNVMVVVAEVQVVAIEARRGHFPHRSVSVQQCVTRHLETYALAKRAVAAAISCIVALETKLFETSV